MPMCDWSSDVCSSDLSSVHSIFQARVLEWGAIAFSGLTIKHPIYLDS